MSLTYISRLSDQYPRNGEVVMHQAVVKLLVCETRGSRFEPGLPNNSMVSEIEYLQVAIRRK